MGAPPPVAAGCCLRSCRPCGCSGRRDDHCSLRLPRRRWRSGRAGDWGDGVCASACGRRGRRSGRRHRRYPFARGQTRGEWRGARVGGGARRRSASTGRARGWHRFDGVGADELIRDRGAWLVSVGRPLLADPYWPLRAADDLGVAPPLPLGYAPALGAGAGELSSAFGRTVSSPDHSKRVDDCTKV